MSLKQKIQIFESSSSDNLSHNINEFLQREEFSSIINIQIESKPNGDLVGLVHYTHEE